MSVRKRGSLKAYKNAVTANLPIKNGKPSNRLSFGMGIATWIVRNFMKGGKKL